MTRDEHLMTIGAEESMELGQRITKAMRFGIGEVQPGQLLNNRARIIDKLNDLLGTLDMIDLLVIVPEKIAAKRRKIELFLRYSQECGTLVDVADLRAQIREYHEKEPPIVRGALDAQEDAERRMYEAKAALKAATDRLQVIANLAARQLAEPRAEDTIVLTEIADAASSPEERRQAIATALEGRSCLVWHINFAWRVAKDEREGYADQLERAGMFTKEQAEEIADSNPGYFEVVPVINKIAPLLELRRIIDEKLIAAGLEPTIAPTTNT